MSRRRRWIALCALVSTVVVADQLVHHVLLADGALRGRPIAPFDPPLFTETQRAKLERLESGAGGFQGELAFDADLGWCPRPDTSYPLYAYDWAGCRVATEPLPHERTEGVRRIVLVGGSFTRGDEVGPTDSWAGRLDGLDDVEIANLGVGGYGPGQAILRWERDGAGLAPDEVWLGVCPAVTLRALTAYWPAMHHWKDSVATKPRFAMGSSGTVGGGQVLGRLPNPARSPEELVALLRDQERFLETVGRSDHWVDRVRPAYAPRGSHPFHHSGFGRLYLTLLESQGRDARARLADPEDELPVLLDALFAHFQELCDQAGVRGRIVVLPDRSDLRLARSGERPWSRWPGLADTTDALLAANADTEEHLWMPGGHYGPRLNEIVAGTLSDLARGVDPQ